jgi:hypothetical protein
MKTIVRNHMAQPIELHLASRTVVMGPHGHAELDDLEVASEHIRHLKDLGQLTLHPVEALQEGKRAASPQIQRESQPAKGKKKK